MLTAAERKLLDYLLRDPFPGRDLLRSQIDAARVSAEYEDGSGTVVLVVDPAAASRANIRTQVPVIARGTDLDGMFVEVLLRVRDGYLDELEIWRGDLGPILAIPDPVRLPEHIVRE
jgi:hypothetical protein